MKLPRRKASKSAARGYLDGQMLIAMPALQDGPFSRSVIYICAHSTDGAMGIIVNHPAANINFPDLLVQLEVIPAADRIQLPPRAETVKVLKGGPVETQRGFVLHSSDFFIENSTLPIGYAGWAAGQLESEIQGNGWLHCAADPELIFGADIESKYDKALRKIGINLGMLSSEAGHA
jgi:putative transcriptional regulator